MKNLFIVLFLLSSYNSFAGIGGSSGGIADSVNSGYTTEVCNINEAGQKISCRMIHFKHALGEPSQFHEPVICQGEGQNTICDIPNAHVPELLKKVNKWFTDRGFNPVNNSNPEIGAGN